MWFGSRLLREKLDNIDWQLGHIHKLIHEIKDTTMSTNQELDDVRALLVEASQEIPAKLDTLLAQVGDAADPALVAEIKDLATGLANIVPTEVVTTTESEVVSE